MNILNPLTIVEDRENCGDKILSTLDKEDFGKHFTK